MVCSKFAISLREFTVQKFRGRWVFIAHFLLWVVFSAQIIYVLVPLVDSPSFGISLSRTKRGSVLEIGDFPFNFNFVQRAWRRETTVSSGSSIYSLKNHLKVTSDWAGTKVAVSLQFGCSPTMLWVLAPLVPFPNATAYLIFNVAGLFAVFWMTRPSRCRWGVGLLAFFSSLARFCFVLGQTALLAGAGFLFIAERTPHGDRDQIRRDALSGCVLWALTAKPPLALTAVAVLSGLRQWRVLFAGGLLSVVSTLIIWPLLGPQWLTDYIHLLGTYNTTDAGPSFVMAVVPGIMANLRAILSVDVGLRDDISSGISLIVWVAALGYITLAGLRSRLPSSVLWSMSILSYLLFCPHVSPTEEMQVMVILALCVSMKDKLTKHELFLLVTVPLLVFISPVSRLFWGMRLPLFLAQLILFFFFVFSKEKFEAQKIG
jgi:hypothetical protein